MLPTGPAPNLTQSTTVGVPRPVPPAVTLNSANAAGTVKILLTTSVAVYVTLLPASVPSCTVTSLPATVTANVLLAPPRCLTLAPETNPV